jgi:hypothetical protein
MDLGLPTRRRAGRDFRGISPEIPMIDIPSDRENGDSLSFRCSYVFSS